MLGSGDSEGRGGRLLAGYRRCPSWGDDKVKTGATRPPHEVKGCRVAGEGHVAATEVMLATKLMKAEVSGSTISNK